MNLWKRNAKQICPERMIGYKYSATGIFGYEFFNGKNKICTVSSIVVSSPPVQIDGYGRRWHSGFDADSTIVPGITRYVYDEANAQAAKVVYRERSKYEIDGAVSVCCEEGTYSFLRNGEIIAQINRYEGELPWMPDPTWFDYEPYFEVFFKEKIDGQLKLLIFSFPMLRFGF